MTLTELDRTLRRAAHGVFHYLRSRSTRQHLGTLDALWANLTARYKGSRRRFTDLIDTYYT
jgi:hypothetical protein